MLSEDPPTLAKKGHYNIKPQVQWEIGLVRRPDQDQRLEGGRIYPPKGISSERHVENSTSARMLSAVIVENSNTTNINKNITYSVI